MRLIRSLARRVTPWMRHRVGFATFDHLRHLHKWPLSTSPLRDAEKGASVFVEPHYDDVVFSCGGTVSALRRAGREVHLASVFTGAPTGPLSPLARTVHATWKDETTAPYDRRRNEAARVARDMGVSHHQLNFPEVIYRDVPMEGIPDIFDPTISVEADPVVGALAASLEGLLDRVQPAVLFLPFAIGAHYDHRVVVAAAERLSLQGPGAPTVWWYEDFPYVANPARAAAHREQGPDREGFALVDVTDTFEDRVRWAAMYEQQCQVLFGTDEGLRSRMHDYAASVGAPDRPHERFWKI